MITEMASEALSSSPGTGRRERRKAETRARLLAAARRLFAERGFDATRPQDVARAADLAVGTFYVHFADKADVFLAFTEDAAREIMEALRARAEGSRGFEERLRRSLEALLAWSDANPGVLAVCFADAAVLSAGGSAGTSGPGTSVSPRAGSRRAGRTAPAARACGSASRATWRRGCAWARPVASSTATWTPTWWPPAWWGSSSTPSCTDASTPTGPRWSRT